MVDAEYEGAAGNYAVIPRRRRRSHVYMHLAPRRPRRAAIPGAGGLRLGAVGDPGRVGLPPHFETWRPLDRGAAPGSAAASPSDPLMHRRRPGQARSFDSVAERLRTAAGLQLGCTVHGSSRRPEIANGLWSVPGAAARRSAAPARAPTRPLSALRIDAEAGGVHELHAGQVDDDRLAAADGGRHDRAELVGALDAELALRADDVRAFVLELREPWSELRLRHRENLPLDRSLRTRGVLHPTMPRTAILALAAALCLIPAAWASHIPGQPCSNCASHEHWPTIDGKLKKARSHTVTFVGTPRSDELLGHHGSDMLRGRGRSDVLWGDHDPDGQPERQRDRIYGGGGLDYLRVARPQPRSSAGPATTRSPPTRARVHRLRPRARHLPRADLAQEGLPRRQLREGRPRSEKDRGGGLKPLP